MAARKQDGAVSARIATIGETMADQFGTDAIRVATVQATGASGDVAEIWAAVLAYLRASREQRQSDEG